MPATAHLWRRNMPHTSWSAPDICAIQHTFPTLISSSAHQLISSSAHQLIEDIAAFRGQRINGQTRPIPALPGG